MKMNALPLIIAAVLLSSCGSNGPQPIPVAPARLICPAPPPCPPDLCQMPVLPSFLSPTSTDVPPASHSSPP